MQKTSHKVLIVLLIFAALVVVCVLLSMRKTDTFEDKYAGVDLATDVAGMERVGTYTGYLHDHSGAKEPSESIAVDLTDYTAEGDVYPVEDYVGEPSALFTDTASVVTFKVNVPEAGFYRLHTRYLIPESRGVAAERCVYINGEIPFERARNINFTRVWENGGPVRVDNRGNEIDLKDIELVRLFSKYKGYEKVLAVLEEE